MESDLKSLVVKNEMDYPQERVTSLLSLLQRGSISYLSPEKEAAPFLFYSCGDDLTTIALKTNYPLEVIQLTALKYRWPIKAKELANEAGKIGLEGIQLDIAKSLLIATNILMQRQLADVIAGRAKASECPLLPKNIHGLEKLMNIITSLTAPKDDGGKSPMSITGQNIQVNLNAPKEEGAVIDLISPNTRDMIKKELGGL